MSHYTYCPECSWPHHGDIISKRLPWDRRSLNSGVTLRSVRALPHTPSTSSCSLMRRVNEYIWDHCWALIVTWCLARKQATKNDLIITFPYTKCFLFLMIRNIKTYLKQMAFLMSLSQALIWTASLVSITYCAWPSNWEKQEQIKCADVQRVQFSMIRIFGCVQQHRM